MYKTQSSGVWEDRLVHGYEDLSWVPRTHIRKQNQTLMVLLSAESHQPARQEVATAAIVQ